MSLHLLVGTVDRMYTDTISMAIEAEDQGDAYMKARQALAGYPTDVTADGVRVMYLDERVQTYADVSSIREYKEDTVA